MKSIIFVCTGNTCRSPLAEVIFRKLLADNHTEKMDGITVRSSGIAARDGASATDNAISVAKEHGLSLENHKATKLSSTLICSCDLIITMTNDHLKYLTQSGISEDKLISLNIKDPYGGSLEVYRECYDNIYYELCELIKKLDE